MRSPLVLILSALSLAMAMTLPAADFSPASLDPLSHALEARGTACSNGIKISCSTGGASMSCSGKLCTACCGKCCKSLTGES